MIIKFAQLWNSWSQLRLQNVSVEQISLNESVLIVGHGFYTKQNRNQTYLCRESNATTYSPNETV
jgi:hypothetical protein